ncbi:YxiF family protein [Lysinibacillus sp. NPDC093688]|uniref:YxiF family protein n=1 Tax=Lysinibacillus sp. NPDC093688 TaxID=3390577 RepID=UPI003CFDAB54
MRKVINLSNDRTTKMELLKRKSRRKNLIKELNFMNLTEEPFLDIEDNDLFCKKVFSVLNTKKNKIQLQGDNYKENIQKSIQLLNEIIDNIELTPKKGNLLFFRENEIEAVLINVHEVFSNLDKVLELTRFSVGYGDFILVAEDFNFGLCIERTEYFYEFSVWGLS